MMEITWVVYKHSVREEIDYKGLEGTSWGYVNVI